jgi:hypothetical protein
MARTSLKNQPWKSVSAKIIGMPPNAAVGKTITASLEIPGWDLRHARIVWEASDQEPAFGKSFNFKPVHAGDNWIEAEAQMPDGRRAFAALNFSVTR